VATPSAATPGRLRMPGSNLAFYLIGSLVELAPPSGNADQIIRQTWLK